MTDQRLRVGFVGAGANTRKYHILGLKAQPGVELMAVANRSRESGERVAKEFGIARVHEDWREIMRAPDIDAICIGTWPYTHCEMVLAALENGKHVLCEARMAMNAAEGRRMLEASRKAPRLVAQLVPAPHTLETDRVMKKLIADGEVGDVLAVDVNGAQGKFLDREGPFHWRHDVALSGHNVMNMGIWYEAMMRWVGPAARVMAMTRVNVPRRKDATGASREVKVPDHVEILIGLERGGVGHLRFSAVTALGPKNEAWVFGSEGTLRLDVDARTLWRGRRGDTALTEVVIPKNERIGWRVEEEFVNTVRGKEKTSHTTFEDGVRYMEFTDAVAKSAATGQAVDVPAL